jgi:hypothetical protein
MARKITVAQFKNQAQVFKALAHPGRLLMLDGVMNFFECVASVGEKP